MAHAQARKIRDVMSKNVVTLAASSSPRDAARAMREHDIGAVVVERNRKVCGIVTDRDLVVRGLADERGLDRELGSFCSQNLVCLGPEQDVGEAVQLMKEKAVRRIPVVDDGRTVGIVSIGDLAQHRDPQSALGTISSAPPNH